MSNIQLAFNKQKEKGHKAFIPFLTAGDPDIASTKQFVLALAEEGSTVIELGIPFSDPVADGPTIQAANLRAFKNDIHVGKVLEMVEEVRQVSNVPIVFLMYANTVYHYGLQAFFKACNKAQVDGIIIPDVPLEEREEFDSIAREYDIDFISLVAPTSKERTKAICEGARGFLYCVSSLGVTGTREEIKTDLNPMFESIKAYSKIPTALGFGISTKEQAAALKEHADGIIVGSAMVKIIEESGSNSEEALRAFTRDILSVL